MIPQALVLRTAGTNCDGETLHALRTCGAKPDLLHLRELLGEPDRLLRYSILVVPGGFSYGDDVAAGKILANEMKFKLAAQIRKFVGEKRLVIGICNGFQVLAKAGLLPGSDVLDFSQTATLAHNDSGRFQCEWVGIKNQNSKAKWLKGLPKSFELPIAHGEGKFVTKDAASLSRLRSGNQIAFTYCDPSGNSAGYPVNPNGSVEDIAGITDETGQILGLMPHPERFFFFTQCPAWTRLERKSDYGDGAKIFENGVRYVREQLL